MKSLLKFINKDTLTEANDYTLNLKTVIGNLANPSLDVPIEPKTFDWVVVENPERLSKTFEFKHLKILKSFLNFVYFLSALVLYL